VVCAEPQVALRIGQDAVDHVVGQTVACAERGETAGAKLQPGQSACGADPENTRLRFEQRHHTVVGQAVRIPVPVSKAGKPSGGRIEPAEAASHAPHPQIAVGSPDDRVDLVVPQAPGIVRVMSHPRKRTGAAVESQQPVVRADPGRAAGFQKDVPDLMAMKAELFDEIVWFPDLLLDPVERDQVGLAALHAQPDDPAGFVRILAQDPDDAVGPEMRQMFKPPGFPIEPVKSAVSAHP